MPGLKPQFSKSLVVLWCVAALAAGVAGAPVRAENTPAKPAEQDPIAISADFGQGWQENGESVLMLRGRCQIVQGATTLTARQMVLWRRSEAAHGGTRERIRVYLEDGARLETPEETLSERTLLLELATRGKVTVQTRRRGADEPAPDDPLFVRAGQRRAARGASSAREARYQPAAEDQGPELESGNLHPPGGGVRRIRIFPRSAVEYTVESFESRDVLPAEQVWVLAGGVQLLLDGINPRGGVVDLKADRMVIWTQLGGDSDLAGEKIQSDETPLQVYLEGNIEVREGQNFMRGNQAFYDAREKRAIFLNAELKTRAFRLPMNIRIRAERIRQSRADYYHAERAWVTTSEFGKPGYRMQMSDVFLEPRDAEASWFSRGDGPFDPDTGEPLAETRLWATAQNNTFIVGDLPVFYYPYISTPAEDVNIPLRTIAFKNDQIFGTQIDTTWNMFKLLAPTGIEPAANARWDVHADYLSLRGFRLGSTGSYNGQDRFGTQGTYRGMGLAYFINDMGTDNLGADRLAIVPQQQARGGVQFEDRQNLPNNAKLLTEFSWLSDRNYLEEYNPMYYYNGKDYESLIYFQQDLGTRSYSVLAQPRLYNYYNQTEFLPRGDVYALGESWFQGRVNWSTHLYGTYADTRIADPATDPNDKYSILSYEGNSQGFVMGKRGEMSAPFNVGPVRVVPYFLGEAAYWGQDYSGNALTRFYYSPGTRASLEFWRSYPGVQSDLFNLNGLAHKMVFDADYSWSYADQPLSIIPQVNAFDDNAQEQFRRRLIFNTFGLTPSPLTPAAVPPTFDPRYYALREGAAHDVSSPYNELVGTQQVARLGWRHRLQTKVGAPNAQRIKDWMTLDLDVSYFPDPSRDNFGQYFGLYGARYNWYVGDRTTINATSYFDTFAQAQSLWSLGVISQRTQRGSVYLATRQVRTGDYQTSNILTASFNYTMSPKWMASVGTAYDLALHSDLGQSVTLTRVGADFLVMFGASIQPLRQNTGFTMMIQPRFVQSMGSAMSSLTNMMQNNQAPR